MPSLVIHLFGPFEVLLTDEPMPRGRTRAVEWLLALLALRTGRAVDRAWLAGTLWPESEESRSLHNLRTALMHLRKMLGSQAGRLQSPTRNTLLLDLTGAEVDVVLFDQAMRAGDEASLLRATGVYRGALLEGCYEEWVLPERETRAAQYLEALEGLAERAQERGEHGAAVRYLRQAESLDPLRESIVRRLMACLVANGEVVAAGEAYRRFRQRLHEEMAAAPDRETVLLYQQIRTRAREAAHPPVPAAKASRTALSPGEAPIPTASPMRPPHPLAPLIGRAEELETVLQYLKQHRLVSLIGAGGIGKTRLAMEVAGCFSEGVVWVELAPITEGALLLSTLATAMTPSASGAVSGTHWSQVIKRLSGGAYLLILDNCEHLVEAVAQLTQELLAHCPDLRVLTTSRKRLGLTGEVTWRVPSLSCPPEPTPTPPPSASSATQENRSSSLPLPEGTGFSGRPGSTVASDVLDYPAVRLFVERAAAVRPGFRLYGSEDAEAVCRICRRLDGIPLALELAAARTNVLTVRQIASRLDDRFRLLIGGSRAAAPRHQTLQALIDWCYYQLSEPEQTLLRRLSVFAGSWSLEAAEQIGSDPSEAPPRPSGSPDPGPISEGQVLDLLASLEDRSLVVVEETADGLRYRMLETVREYGQEKLQASGEERAMRERHAEHYLALAELAYQAHYHADPAWLERLETEHDNLRTALTSFAAQETNMEKAVRLAAALASFWNTRGHDFEQRTWLIGLAKRPTAPTEARLILLSDAGWVAARNGEFAAARQMFVERLEIWRQWGDRWGVADTLIGLAGLLSDRTLSGSEYDPVTARTVAEESLAIMRELDHRQGIGQGCYVLGRLARQAGDGAAAQAFWRECRAIDVEQGVRGGHVLPMLGELALESRNPTAATRDYQMYLDECHQTGNRWGIAWALRGLSMVALALEQPERAAQLLVASLALRETSSLLPEERACYEALRSSLRETLDESVLDAAWEAGKAMSLEQVTAYALEET